MLIKKLSALFGSLENKSISLKDGLNIVRGDNEAGKSTWCAFIRAMLYGINTSEKDKEGSLADKTRFKPWSGLPMEGTMDINMRGKDITLQRLSKGVSGAMKLFSATFSGTNEPVEGITSTDAGEVITGVSEKVFERSAFIRQSGAAVGQTADLEKRVAALVSSGEEEISYTETDAALRKWQRKRKHNQNGLLPKLDERLEAVAEKLKYMEEANRRYADLKSEFERFEKLRDDFLGELDLYERRERAEGRALLAEADEKRKSLNAEAERLEASLSRSGKMPPREEAEYGRELMLKYEAAEQKSESLSARAVEKAAEQKIYEDRKNASVFAPESVSEVKAKVRGISERLEKRGKMILARRILGAVIMVAAVIAIFVAAGGLMQQLIFGAAAVAGLLLGILGTGKDRQLSQYGVKTVSELSDLVSEYEMACALLEQSEREAKSSEAEAEAAFIDKTALAAEIIEKGKLFNPDAGDIRAAEGALSKACADYALLENLIPQRDAAEKFYNALSGGDYGTDTERPEDVPKSKYSRAEVSSGLKYAERELSALSSAFNMAQGEIKTIGDPIVLGAEKEQLLAERAELAEEYEALSLAIDTLREADAEIQARFAPVISKRAAEIMATFTGGKYETLVFDKNLSASIGERDASVTHSSLYLSEGTTDQLYLALRLAICEIVLPEDDPCPIILDDALANFDDIRMGAALNILRKQAQKRQIVLFSCHSREAEYFKNDDTVNIINL